MSDLKTKKSESNIFELLEAIPDENKRRDCNALIEILKEITGYQPKMWGTSIVGFGSYHYKYASGHEGDTCVIGFSPRKANITVYLFPYLIQQESMTKYLGTFKTGKECLYFNNLSDINLPAFKNLVQKSIELTKEHYSVENASKP